MSQNEDFTIEIDNSEDDYDDEDEVFLLLLLHYFTTPLTPEVTSGASTKSYSSFTGELEQVIFQLVFECIRFC